MPRKGRSMLSSLRLIDRLVRDEDLALELTAKGIKYDKDADLN